MSTAIIEDMKGTDHKVSKPAGDGNGTYSGKGKKVEKAGMAGKKAVTPPKSSVSAKAGGEKALVKKAASEKEKKIPANAGKRGKEASLSKTVEKKQDKSESKSISKQPAAKKKTKNAKKQEIKTADRVIPETALGDFSSMNKTQLTQICREMDISRYENGNLITKDVMISRIKAEVRKIKSAQTRRAKKEEKLKEENKKIIVSGEGLGDSELPVKTQVKEVSQTEPENKELGSEVDTSLSDLLSRGEIAKMMEEVEEESNREEKALEKKENFHEIDDVREKKEVNKEKPKKEGFFARLRRERAKKKKQVSEREGEVVAVSTGNKLEVEDLGEMADEPVNISSTPASTENYVPKGREIIDKRGTDENSVVNDEHTQAKMTQTDVNRISGETASGEGIEDTLKRVLAIADIEVDGAKEFHPGEIGTNSIVVGGYTEEMVFDLAYRMLRKRNKDTKVIEREEFREKYWLDATYIHNLIGENSYAIYENVMRGKMVNIPKKKRLPYIPADNPDASDEQYEIKESGRKE